MRLQIKLLTVAMIFFGPIYANGQLLSRPIGQWEAQAVFRALDRPILDSANTTIFFDGASGSTLLDSNTATDLNIAVGPDISFSSTREDGMDYEIRFFFTHANRTTLTQADDLRSPFFPGVSFREANGSYQSDVFNIELNQKRAINSYFRVLHGIRYFHVEETFAYDTTGLLFVPTAVPFTGNSTTDVKNPMLGYHIGAESRVTIVPGMHIEFFGKSGLFNNFSSQSTSQSNSLLPGVTRLTGTENRMAFVADGGIRFQFDVVENFMTVFGGYDAMFVDGFAAAPGNVNRSSGVNNDFELWMHGVTFGIKVVR